MNKFVISDGLEYKFGKSSDECKSNIFITICVGRSNLHGSCGELRQEKQCRKKSYFKK